MSIKSVEETYLSVGDLLAQLDERLYPLGEAPHNSAASKSGSDVDMEIYEAFLEDERAQVPVLLKVMYAAGAWLMALLTLLFLSIFGLYKSSIAMLLLGMCLTAFGQVLSKEIRDTIQHQAMLTTSLVGQGLAIAGIHALFTPGQFKLIALFCIALQMGLLYVNKDTFHRFLSLIVINVSVAILIYDIPVVWPFFVIGYTWACVLVWLPEAQGGPWHIPHALKEPLQYGFALSVLASLLPSLVAIKQLPVWGKPLTSIGIALAWGWLAMHLMKQENTHWSNTYKLVAVGFATIGLALYNAPGVLASGLIFTLGFSQRARLIMALGLLSLLAYTVGFYIGLPLTSIPKTLSLVLPGLLMLGLRQLLMHRATGGSHA